MRIKNLNTIIKFMELKYVNYFMLRCMDMELIGY